MLAASYGSEAVMDTLQKDYGEINFVIVLRQAASAN
jgi:hypothetical protein